MRFTTHLLLTTLLFLLLAIVVYSQQQDINLTAEEIVYDKQNGIVIAKKDVVIRYQEITLNTEYAVYEIENGIVYTTTSTTVRRDNEIFVFDSLVYDIKNATMSSTSLWGYFEPYYCYGKSCIMTEKKYTFLDAKITHCDLSKPHYYFSSKKVIIYPKDKIKIYNPTLVLWSVPMLWFPYHEISLKPRRDCVIIEPGYDSFNGYYAKTRYIYSISDYTSVHILFDLFEKQGTGAGLEYRYSLPTHTGIFYTYYIKQKQDNKTRWNLLWSDSYSFAPLWSMQSKIEFLSDESMYYYYDKSNWYFVKNDINSIVSFVRNTPKNALRLTYYRSDEYIPSLEKFVNRFFQLPVSFLYYPISIGKFSMAESFSFVPTFVEGKDGYEISTANEINGSYSLKLFWFAFTPQVSLQTYFIRPKMEESYYYNNYNLTFPIRYRIRDFGVADISYNYGLQSERNNFFIDNNKNITRNNLSSRIDIYKSRKYFSAYCNYNFLIKDDNWKAKFSPVITDIGTSYNKFYFNFNAKFNIKEEILESSQISLGYDFSLQDRITLTYSNIYSQQIQNVNTSLDFGIKDLWRFKVQLINNLTSGNYEILSEKYEIYRSLHCWEAKISYNSRKGVQEIWGYIGFRFKSPESKIVADLNRQYLPWRH